MYKRQIIWSGNNVLLSKIKFFIEILSSIRNWFSVIMFIVGLKRSVVVVFRNGITVKISDRLKWQVISYLCRISLNCPIVCYSDGRYRILLGDNTGVTFQINEEDSIYRAYILSILYKRLKIKLYYEDGFCKFYFNGREVIYFFDKNDFSSIENLYVTFVRERNTYGALKIRDKVVADIGASFGDSAIFFALMGAKKVYAYEPVPWAAKVLEKNIKANNLSDIVKVYPYAVSFNEGKATLLVPKNNTGAASLYFNDGKHHVAGRREKVVMRIPVEKTVPPSNVDAAKIDCEGCEYDIVKFMRDAIFDEIIVEYHSDYKPLARKLTDLGYEVKMVSKISEVHGVLYAYNKRKHKNNLKLKRCLN